MNADELAAVLVTATEYGQEAIVMVTLPNGTMYEVNGVEIERHDPRESVGGTTVWLRVEEY